MPPQPIAHSGVGIGLAGLTGHVAVVNHHPHSLGGQDLVAIQLTAIENRGRKPRRIGSWTNQVGRAVLPDDLLNAYLREIPAQRALSVDAERALVERIAAGRTARQRLRDAALSDAERARLHEAIAAAEDARQRLIAEHLPLVVSLARPYAWRGVSLMDLVQEGNVGLLQAIEKFDPQRGVRLATYAA